MKPVEAPRIFTSIGFAPEAGGYALAKFSRSDDPYEKWISELTQKGAEKFYSTFYFQYGHASIADLVHINLVIEDVPLPFAVEVFKEQLVDGQESSTRYQDYSKRQIYIPVELLRAAKKDEKNGVYGSLATTYTRYAYKLINTYQELNRPLAEFLLKKYSSTKPENLDAEQATRTANARTFDRIRYLLPYAVNTGLGVILSARTAEQMLIRLLSHPLLSVREFAQQIHQAIVSQPAYNPLAEKLDQYLRSTPLKESFIDGAREIALDGIKAAPTLIKYAQASKYIVDTRKEISKAARKYLGHITPESGRGVHLYTHIHPELELVATILYSASQHSFKQALDVASALSNGQRQDIKAFAKLLDLPFKKRGVHDKPLPETITGYNLIFDIETDNGAFRDLNRHRNAINISQELTFVHGFDIPQDIIDAGLEPQYSKSMKEVGKTAQYIDSFYPGLGQFLLPLGYRRKMLWKMDSRQLQYIVENRTTPENHFSNREIAYQMFQEYAKLYPSFAKHIRAIDPSIEDFWRR